MTCKERVTAALRFEEADAIPYNVSVDPEVAARLDAHYGARERWPRYENHFAGSGWQWRTVELGGGRFQDAFGVVWDNSNIFHIHEPLLKEPSLEGVTFPEIVREEEMPALREWCRQNADRFTLYGLGMLFFERAWALRGFENILMDFALSPAFVEELFDRLMYLHLDALDRLLAIPELDAIRFGDDFGQQRGLIMGPQHWRRYLKPRLARMYGKVRAAGKVVAIHSCGDNSEILGDLIDIGVQILNPAQPEAMDLYALKRQYGRQVVFNGGIGTQGILPQGTPDQVRAEVRRVARELGAGGGLVMETTKPILPGVPTANAIACLETMLEEAYRPR